MSDINFKRIFILPKKWFLYAGTGPLRCSMRAKYIYHFSRKRFERRSDAFISDAETLKVGSIGRIEGFRFIKGGVNA